MAYKLTDKTCVEFSKQLASSEPVPGGGGAAALVGALGSALCTMVGNLTTGRKKYAQYEEDVQRMIKESEEIRAQLIELIDRDAEGFWPLQKAYSIPKDDPARAETLVKVSVDACQAPMEMMRLVCRAIDLLEEMREKGSRLLVSDVGCGALCCRAALECASMNIFINTKGLPEDVAGELEREADAMLKEYIPKAEKTAQLVMEVLRG